MRPLGKILGAVLLLAVGVALLFAGVRLHRGWLPYQARAVVRTDPDFSQKLDTNADLYINHHWLQTECEVMQSELILNPVVVEPEIAGWLTAGSETTPSNNLPALRARVKERLHWSQPGSTNLFAIEALGNSASEAATLANSLARHYVQYRFDQAVAWRSNALKTIQAELDKVNQRIQQQQAQWNAAAPPADATPATVTPEQMQADETFLIENESALVREEKFLAGLKAMERKQLWQALPTASADDTMASLLEEQTLARMKLTTLQTDGKAAAAELARARARVEGLEAKLDSQARRILAGVEARIQSLKSAASNAQRRIALARKETAERQSKAKRAVESRQPLHDLERYQSLLQEQLRGLNLITLVPDGHWNAVSIVEPAVPPTRPRLPVLTDFFAAFAAGAVCVCLGLGLLFRAVMAQPHSVARS